MPKRTDIESILIIGAEPNNRNSKNEIYYIFNVNYVIMIMVLI